MGKRILVIGATGFVGSAVVQRLADDGFSVRALVRDKTKAEGRFGSGVETFVGAFTERAVLERALVGCDGANISVPWRYEAQVAGDVTAILATAGRSAHRVSYISGISVRADNRRNPMVAEKLRAEAALAASDVAFTILKPNWFLDALALFVREGRATVFGKMKHPFRFLALSDFAAAVSAEHRNGSNVRRTVVIEGPEDILMTEALQRYCDAHHPGIKAATMAPWFGRLLAGLMKSPEMRDFVDLLAFFDSSPRLCCAEDFDRPLVEAKTGIDQWLGTAGGR